MISIEEKQSKHVPGLTSLFISFRYNQDIVDKIKSQDCSYYNSKEKIWECPISCLHNLLDELCQIDTVELSLLKDKKEISKEIKLDTSKYQTKPFDYQLEAIRYGLCHDKWMLLDAPGLGKTLTMILLAQELKQRENIEHVLVICGVNSLKTNWKNEIRKHSKLSCKILGERTKRTGNVVIGSIQDRVNDLKKKINEFIVITNIETIRNNDIVKNINKGPNRFDLVIIDEAHTIRTSSSIQGENILKIKSPKYKVALTGTVITNNPLDAYMPLKWIDKERSAKSTFEYFYTKYGGPFGNEFLGYRNIDYLKDQLSDCSLRRTKDLLNLPEKNIIHEFVDMNPKQLELYNNIKKGIIQQVDKVHISTANLLAMLARLRQATACPSILTTENIKSSKIDRAIDIIDQVTSNNEKIVIFSTFKETLNVLSKELSNYNVLLCTGATKESELQNNIDRFMNNDNYKILLATWQKMGTGLTLTSATYALFIDCPWTYAQCEQAEDRIHRIGSTKPVFIYYLWANESVDLRVKELVEDKSLISSFIVDNEVPPMLKERLEKIIYEL